MCIAASATAAPAYTATAVATSSARQYAGSRVSTDYGTVQVTITVKGTTITDVTAATSLAAGRSQLIEQQAVTTLRQETLAAQSARVDAVSGVTSFSNGYIQSLQTARANAGLA